MRESVGGMIGIPNLRKLNWCAGSVLGVSAAGCTRAVSHAPIIDRYNAAACVAVRGTTTDPNHSVDRRWDAILPLSNKEEIIVRGDQIPGGRIDVIYPNGQDVVAADAGDYVYPSDVRFDARNGFLYVKCDGLAIFRRETWLFEYDLVHQQLLKRQRVVPGALPAECPAQ